MKFSVAFTTTFVGFVAAGPVVRRAPAPQFFVGNPDINTGVIQPPPPNNGFVPRPITSIDDEGGNPDINTGVIQTPPPSNGFVPRPITSIDDNGFFKTKRAPAPQFFDDDDEGELPDINSGVIAAPPRNPFVPQPITSIDEEGELPDINTGVIAPPPRTNPDDIANLVLPLKN